MENRSIKKILVAGSGYGEHYFSAIHSDPQLQVCALLAQGSRRSVRVAEQNGIPLLKQAGELDQVIQGGIDAACVAVGGEDGIEIAIALLEKQVPVLLEHPHGVESLQRLFHAQAQHSGAHCHINSHFSYLPPAQQFIRACHTLMAHTQPLHINVYCNTRTLFSTLDLLWQSFTQPEYRILATTTNGDYAHISSELMGVPCTLNYQRWRYVQDDSRDAPLGHHITVVYPTGTLQLTGSYGPCIWQPLVTGAPAGMPLSLQTQPPANLHTLLTWRLRENANAIHTLLDCASGYRSAPLHQSPDFLLSLAATWDNIFHTNHMIERDFSEAAEQPVDWAPVNLFTD